MFNFAKKGGSDKKVNSAPVSETNLKYEKTLHDLRSRREEIQDNINRIDSKIITLDQEIKQLIKQGKKQLAKNRIGELKALQKQIEQMQVKYNVITQMTIQLETSEQDKDIMFAVKQAAELGKQQEEINENLKESLEAWRDNQESLAETAELWKKMSEMGVNNEEIDEELDRYMKENEQQKVNNVEKQFSAISAIKIPAQQNNQQQNKTSMQIALDQILD